VKEGEEGKPTTVNKALIVEDERKRGGRLSWELDISNIVIGKIHSFLPIFYIARSKHPACE
jgi:hypothetical protein